MAAGRLAERNTAGAQRPEPSTGLGREGRDETQDEGGRDVHHEDGKTAVSERAMPPRYGPARIGGSL
jgi:hypothetical protein